MSLPYLQPSRDAARSLEEFSDLFRGALAVGEVPLWAATHGVVDTSDALLTTYPIPISAAGYSEFRGDIKYRTLYERSVQLMTKTWTDGVEEFAEKIELGDFIGWADQPNAMAAAWLRHPNKIAMAMLESNGGLGPLLDLYKDKDSNAAVARNLFAADHPANVLQEGVNPFGNIKTTTTAKIQSGVFFDECEDYFSQIKAPNGDQMGFTMGGATCLVHSTRRGLFKRALEGDTIVRAVSNAGALDASANVVAAAAQPNLWKGAIGYDVTLESSQPDVFYVVAGGGPAENQPWVVLKRGAVEEIVHDKSSAKYKETLKVGMATIGRAAVGAMMPHRLLKVTITG